MAEKSILESAVVEALSNINYIKDQEFITSRI